jgi:hypothetical protein
LGVLSFRNGNLPVEGGTPAVGRGGGAVQRRLLPLGSRSVPGDHQLPALVEVGGPVRHLQRRGLGLPVAPIGFAIALIGFTVPGIGLRIALVRVTVATAVSVAGSDGAESAGRSQPPDR